MREAEEQELEAKRKYKDQDFVATVAVTKQTVEIADAIETAMNQAKLEGIPRIEAMSHFASRCR